MLIALVIILLLIWAAVVWSIYSNFMVFYSNFAESESYHRAYYNSIAALERAELVIKQRSPWYVWRWWWELGGKNKGSYEEWSSSKEWGSDRVIEENFSYISDSRSKNISSIYWTINSRATRIPAEWNWDIDSMLAYKNEDNSRDPENSDNFNMMDYKDSQVFLLYYDKSIWNPYEKVKCSGTNTDCEQSYPSKIQWVIRLPKKLNSFGELDDLNPLITSVEDLPENDAIVDRQIRWRYYSSNGNYPFNIYSTQNNDDDGHDSAIRESDINQTLNFEFSSSNRSPTTRWNNLRYSEDLTIISPKETEIKDDNGVKNNHFSEILGKQDKFKEKQLRLSLLNLLKTKNNMTYPFLEYYVEFKDGDNPVQISDKYFTINAEWIYDDYQINKLVWKPTNKESILWSFTTIF